MVDGAGDRRGLDDPEFDVIANGGVGGGECVGFNGYKDAVSEKSINGVAGALIDKGLYFRIGGEPEWDGI